MNDKEMLFKISLLISKSLSGDITKEEQTELDSWREKSEYNKKLFERICSEMVMRKNLLNIRVRTCRQRLIHLLKEERNYILVSAG